ncbi:hypothetical protein BB561_006754 [Smittium simulii]|uniref:Diphthine--ammonia ligase n=1 Tax=Smittium simulii TaxID=133385 RepID=A0A2T9Y1Q6_9FUNG|nr:hypothetical protein BB561_006754 [Smittium simulii]
MDSFLFQTVGQTQVPYIAECMGLPLFQEEIRGSALDQELDYSKTTGDETEDLYSLIKKVKEAHPDVEGVSVGAILSSYQANRVKNVCERLGLEVLACLWQKDQQELLDEMIDSKLEAVLIKVAGIGLGKVDLLKNLKQMREKLMTLNKKYGTHVCGEGGEYESFTLDCPLFKKKIEIVEWETIIHSDDAFAPVCLAKINKVKLIEK